MVQGTAPGLSPSTCPRPTAGAIRSAVADSPLRRPPKQRSSEPWSPSAPAWTAARASPSPRIWPSGCLKEKALKPTTFTRYRDHVRADLIPTFGRLPMTHLRARHIIAWSEAELARGRGRTAVYRIGATFSSALSHAMRSRVIVANPCRYVLLPRPVAPERICWNPAQAAAFLRRQPCSLRRSDGRSVRDAAGHRHAAR
ncbi:hypothetical protein GTZ78_46285 [Streptomyces sp. SID8361]|uniref:hypothetical protein n=1 Tax=Streptomyces sp. MnatMP-M27 TaxID=1839768 RepID=UPI000B86BC9B|nr:hypothetical protein [Streptomyces sp. SID8361]